MKRFLSLFLALLLAFSLAFCFVGCEEERESSKKNKESSSEEEPSSSTPTVEAPDGYTVYSNDDIAFAYPEDWTKTDGSVTMLVNASGVGNNITVAYEAKNTAYESLTASEWESTMEQLTGMSLSNVSISKVTNEAGVSMTKVSQKVTTNGVTMTQTLFIVHVGSKTYTISTTFASGDNSFVDVAFDTLTKLK